MRKGIRDSVAFGLPTAPWWAAILDFAKRYGKLPWEIDGVGGSPALWYLRAHVYEIEVARGYELKRKYN